MPIVGALVSRLEGQSQVARFAGNRVGRPAELQAKDAGRGVLLRETLELLDLIWGPVAPVVLRFLGHLHSWFEARQLPGGGHADVSITEKPMEMSSSDSASLNFALQI